jgi:SAM-dependent methyltransferase
MPGTPAAYDAIARDYQRTKSSPVRTAVEGYTLLTLLGDCRGRAILDAGCGDGFYARRLMAAGAARVAGVDVSPAMIELARAEERADPLGIHYACCAVEDLPDLFCAAGFDVALASYLLHYAPTEEVLRRMCRRLANVLVPGGRLVALTENPEQDPADYGHYAAYGFDKQALELRGEGSRIGYGLVSGRQIIRIETFWYSRGTYESALAAAGFEDVRWSPLLLDPAVPSPEYYAAYVANPPVLGLVARKSRP